MRRMGGALLGALVMAATAGSAQAATLEVRSLSNRADIVSGGDVLAEVVVPKGVDPAKVTVAAGGRDVTKAFAVRPDGRLTGYVDGLPDGRTDLVARAPGATGAKLTVTNHPHGGPVTSGPQIQPWTCFPGAVDKQCNRPPSFNYTYKRAGSSGFVTYDPASPPSDAEMVTTDSGARVPFLVREEVGTIDRDEYRIAVLFDPREPWAPGTPQKQFAHKMVITHGASCDTSYEQAQAPDVMVESALRKGMVVMSHALDNAGHNCNIALQAEALIMTKEYVIERYGELRYTIGTGCSGGSLTQQQVANAYPGLYQGITPACSFPDAWSSAQLYIDYELLRRYLENPLGWGAGVVWTPEAIQAVEGHVNPVNAITFTEVIPSSGNPSRSCPGVPPEQVFDEQTNPKGVRCSLQDYMVNVFGRDPRTGYAQRPFDNVGIQYGLKGLLSGKLTPAQFVDVNAKLGGWGINYDATKTRIEADRPALGYLYRSGAINQGDHLDEVAIIDLRGPDPGAFHDVYRTYVMRARLEREHGTAANQVLWRGAVPLFGDTGYVDESILAMDKWLAAVEKDTRAGVPLARKVIDNKPADVTDRCTNGTGVPLPASACDAAVEAYSSARIEAGGSLTDDTMKCELVPLRRDAYGSVTFTDDQWAALRQAFPQGVCDYGKPGVDRAPTVTWLSYADGPGGRPLGTAPASKPLAVPAAATLGVVGRSCVSKRRLKIRLKARRGDAIRTVRVAIRGRRTKTLRGRRASAPIDLRGLPAGTVRVKVTVTTRKGKRTTITRRYRTCANGGRVSISRRTATSHRDTSRREEPA